jgi:hypothetical protein
MNQNTQPLSRSAVMTTMEQWFQGAEEHRKEFEAALPDTTGWDYSDYLSEFHRTVTEIRATYAEQPFDPSRLSQAMHAFHVLQAISYRAGYRATMTTGDPDAKLVLNDGTVTFGVTFNYNAILKDSDVQG